MNPSGIRLPENGRYTLREVKPGLFLVDNAYSGRYEFFKGRPAPPVTPQSTTPESPSDNGHNSHSED